MLSLHKYSCVSTISLGMLLFEPPLSALSEKFGKQRWLNGTFESVKCGLGSSYNNVCTSHVAFLVMLPALGKRFEIAPALLPTVEFKEWSLA